MRHAIASSLATAVVTVTLAAAPPALAQEEHDPPEVAVGERLFLETRFSQYFASHMRGDVNAVLAVPDPAVAEIQTPDGPLRGAFDAMNCRQCHLVDDKARDLTAGDLTIRIRTYADFARRSPVPRRDDGQEVTLRNSPTLVGASRRRTGSALLHFDGEFASPEDLVVGTFTGRNFGWKPDEREAAIRHIARVIREDDGRGPLAEEFGGRYRDVLRGEGVDPAFRIPPRFRIDVERASDGRVVRAVARLVAAYLRGLDFRRDALGRHVGSPYDEFLRWNGLPRAPAAGERASAYAVRLRRAVDRLAGVRFLDSRFGHFEFHERPFAFGPEELRGLRVFLATPESRPGATRGVGNCVACHAPPEFTDQRFHNTGVSQREYDGIHGAGAFEALAIPDLASRNTAPSAWLPATAERPDGTGTFASIPSAAAPGRADLGLWNVLFDPGRSRPQSAIRRRFAAQNPDAATDDALLARSVAAFRTPTLRDLGQSGPYLHDGSVDGLAKVVRTYADASNLARAGRLLNAAPELLPIRLDDEDVGALAAFLRALNEDYD